MTIEIRMDEIGKKIIAFQEKEYAGSEIRQHIVDHKGRMQKEKEIEIFPGIFYSWKKEGGIKKVCKALLGMQHAIVVFDIRNARDRFEIFDGKNVCSQRKQGIPVASREKMYPSDILYPNKLGGGHCKGCPVIDYFDGLVNAPSYRIIKESDILEQTKQEQYFVNMCKSSKCYKTFRDIAENGYNHDLPDEKDMIKIDKENAQYVPVEGKHRICAMKRYDYSQPITVILTDRDGEDSKSHLLLEYVPTDSDLKKYYECFERYSLSADEVREYLSDKKKKLYKMVMEKKKRAEPYH